MSAARSRCWTRWRRCGASGASRSPARRCRGFARGAGAAQRGRGCSRGAAGRCCSAPSTPPSGTSPARGAVTPGAATDTPATRRAAGAEVVVAATVVAARALAPLRVGRAPSPPSPPRVLLARLLVVAPLRRPGRRLPSHACGASWRRCSRRGPREVDAAPARARGRPPMGGTPAPAGGASLRPRLLGASAPSARAGRRGPRAPAAAAEVVPHAAPVRALASPVLESARTPRRGRRRARPQPYPTPRGGARARRVGGIRHAGAPRAAGGGRRRGAPFGYENASSRNHHPRGASRRRASKRRPHDAHGLAPTSAASWAPPKRTGGGAAAATPWRAGARTRNAAAPSPTPPRSTLCQSLRRPHDGRAFGATTDPVTRTGARDELQ